MKGTLKIEGKIYSSCKFKKVGSLYLLEDPEELVKVPKYSIVLIRNSSDNLYNLYQVKYKIEGILSVNANLLSHLAVLSRELNIPCLNIEERDFLKIKNYFSKFQSDGVMSKLDCTKGLYREGSLFLYKG